MRDIDRPCNISAARSLNDKPIVLQEKIKYISGSFDLTDGSCDDISAVAKTFNELTREMGEITALIVKFP